MRLGSSYSELLERFYQHELRTVQRLFEMNVANLDDIKSRFTALLDQTIAARNVQVPAALRDMIIKRAVKAMGNDEAGNMTKREPVTVENAPENAPAWLMAALTRNDEVWNLQFKDGFEARLAHVVDWIAADPQAARAIKAAPELDFLGHVAQSADQFFAKEAKTTAKQETHDAENGRVVVMTFRLDPNTQKQVAYKEDNLTTDDRGPVVSFWARLDSAEALNREGRLMSHCVGSYANMVAAEEVVIYSLRDAKNEPHCTIELDQRHGTPRINQVKGKGNRSPIGKYAGYIRDFLNEMGVSASYGGVGDLRGVGLLTHNGKFGTIVDVGGNIVHTFANGDSLRFLDVQEEKTNRYHPRHKPPLDFYYVERDGTVPFEVKVLDDATRKRIIGFTLLRKETSKFATYEKNLIELFNQDKMASDRDTLQQIGVFYDSVKKIWGTKDDLSEHLFDYKGFQINRFGTDIWFFYDGVFTASFQIRGPTLDVPTTVKIENDTPGLVILPEAFAEFLNKYVYDKDFSLSDLTDAQKQIMYRFGVFPRKNGLGGVPDRQEFFKSAKGGSVRHYQHRFYFYNKANSLIGTCYLGATQNNKYEIPLDKVDAFGDANQQEIYRLISEMTQDATKDVRIGQWTRREVIEKGYTAINSKLIPLSDIEQTKPLKDGFVVDISAAEYGGRKISIKEHGRDVVGISTNEKNVVENIWPVLDDEERYRHGRYGSTAGLDKFRVQVAAALNLAHVVMRRRDMLKYYLNEKNGKFVPVNDPILIQLMMGGRIDLGKGFVFVSDGNFTVERDRDNDRRFEPKRWGRIEHADREYGTIVNVQFTDYRKDELQYHMHRIPKDASYTREDVIKASAQLMKLFHDKIEPYLSSDYVGSGSRPEKDDYDA